MALPNPPELRRLAAFMDGLPACPRGCANGFVYPSPTFSVDGLLDDQVTEIIARYEREAAGMLQQHLAEDHRSTAFTGLRPAASGYLTREMLEAAIARLSEAPMLPVDPVVALAGQAHRVVEVDRAAAWQRIRGDLDTIAAQLTATLPADMRAAGIRFEWTEEQ